VPIAAEAGSMQQNVRQATVRDDETEALGDIEPFDPAGDLLDCEPLLLVIIVEGRRSGFESDLGDARRHRVELI
jgi:hypothetical protein